MSFADLLASADSAVLDSLAGAETVEFRTGYGVYQTVQAIFEAKHQSVSLGEMGISAFAPSLFVRLSDLPSDPRDDDGCSFIVNGRHYSPRDVQRDGQGFALIKLEQRDTDEDAA